MAKHKLKFSINVIVQVSCNWMTISALNHIVRTTWKNFWFNRDKRKYRQALINQMPDPVKLSPNGANARVIRIPLLPIQVFNTWKLDGTTFTIISRSHPRIYAFLMRRFHWARITGNSTGSVVAEDNTIKRQKTPFNGEPRIAISGCVLTGFEHAERWLLYYSALPEVKKIYWYVNAPVAPQFLLDLEKKIKPLQLISWDYPFKVARNHYLKTFQKGHALPGAYADSKFRAISDGCTHLMHIDMDEFIHPIGNLPKYASNKTTYFLSAYGRGPIMGSDGNLTLQNTMVANAKSSSYNASIGSGTSGDKSVQAAGKSIAPLRLDAVSPENHSFPTPDSSLIEIPRDTVMLHFLEMEGVRSYPSHYPFSPLAELDIPEFTQEHLQYSLEKTMEYIMRKPEVHTP